MVNSFTVLSFYLFILALMRKANEDGLCINKIDLKEFNDYSFESKKWVNLMIIKKNSFESRISNRNKEDLRFTVHCLLVVMRIIGLSRRCDAAECRRHVSVFWIIQCAETSPILATWTEGSKAYYKLSCPCCSICYRFSDPASSSLINHCSNTCWNLPLFYSLLF